MWNVAAGKQEGNALDTEKLFLSLCNFLPQCRNLIGQVVREVFKVRKVCAGDDLDMAPTNWPNLKKGHQIGILEHDVRLDSAFRHFAVKARNSLRSVFFVHQFEVMNSQLALQATRIFQILCEGQLKLGSEDRPARVNSRC